jgi:hypothetical protein
LAVLAWGYGLADRKADADVLIEELHERAREEFVAPGFLAWAYAGLGEPDRAIEWLERSLEARDAHLAHVLDMPFYDAIRSDPRFTELRRKVREPTPEASGTGQVAGDRHHGRGSAARARSLPRRHARAARSRRGSVDQMSERLVREGSVLQPRLRS